MLELITHQVVLVTGSTAKYSKNHVGNDQHASNMTMLTNNTTFISYLHQSNFVQISNNMVLISADY